MIDLEPLLQKIRHTVQQHEITTGQYSRFTLNQDNMPCELIANPYGCADAANIAYTLGDFPSDPDVRAAAIKHLQDFQDPETGFYQDVRIPDCYFHHPYHTTAHCTAALELFDARPRYELKGLKRFLDVQEMDKLLDEVDWLRNPWSDSHKGAGVYSALVNTGMADYQWRTHFFDYLNRYADPEYGMSRIGTIQTGKARLSHHLNGWFHYLFCYNHANAAFPYPDKLIDSCLSLCTSRPADEHFGACIEFQEVDWVFPLNRAVRQTGYRLDEVKNALRDFASKYIAYLKAHEYDSKFDDLHGLFGVVCCLSELYLALPGEFKAEKPLKNVLDRRPFI